MADTGVHIVSLGCARNDVDSEELAGRLQTGGFALVADPAAARVILVNTCGFIEQAKKDSIDTILAAAEEAGGQARVVAVGCLAERYGRELAEALPEADAVLGFDAYADIDQRLRRLIAGERLDTHEPSDRRRLLPVMPVARPGLASTIAVPGHGDPVVHSGPASGPRPMRRRLQGGPMAAVKIASGCDRRCAFCAIPSFRGAFLSRDPHLIVDEVEQLVADGVREVFLVSENTTSYGKDFGQLSALEGLLNSLSKVAGLDWIRLSYLQPAEIRPGLIEAICATDKVVPYFDLSFQHAAPMVLRRMRRFGDPEAFLALLGRIRGLAPTAGIRSNVIVGFPGETEADVAQLLDFLEAARLDAVGVFAYSDEEGTEAFTLADHVDAAVTAERLDRMSAVTHNLMEQRAEGRIGERVRILVESVTDGSATGRAAHQGPDVDPACLLPEASADIRVGQFIWGRVTATEGVDLVVTEEGTHDR